MLMLNKLSFAFVLAAFLAIIAASSLSGAESSSMEEASFPLTRTVIIDSSPSGATIWKKTGKEFECINVKTPGSVKLSFRSKNDVKKLSVRKFGYVTEEVLVRAADERLEVKLKRKDLFRSLDESDPNRLRQIRTNVKKVIDAFVTTNKEDPFGRSNFEFVSFGVNDQEGKPFFDIIIALDQNFGGSKFSKITRMRNKQQRRQGLVKEILGEAVADVLGQFRGIIGENSGLKGLSVTAFFSTSKKILTEHPEYFLKTYTYDYGSFIQYTTVRHRQEKTVVDEIIGFGFVSFHMLLSQIPNSKERQLVATGVMESGTIFLKEKSGGEVIQFKRKSGGGK